MASLTLDEFELAKNNYGYGRWDAPYWFIGPEQGQATEENDELSVRASAFKKYGSDGLCDCLAFHNEIGELRWHKTDPALQSTWRPLILLLITYLGGPTGQDWDIMSLRNYQRLNWGMKDPQMGQSCVIELSGLPANSFRIPRDRETFREERLEKIYRLLMQYRPEFAVIYGKSQKKYWLRFLRRKGIAIPSSVGSFTIGTTALLFTLHPVRSPGNQYWVDWGKNLANVKQLSL